MRAARPLAVALLAAALAPDAAALHAKRFDPAPAWPLCGRIGERPPPRWSVADGCPRARWGKPAFSDHPISSTFGPRRLPSERYRYDFHRGIDLATPEGTPIFAIADGFVRIAGRHSGYRDPLVEVRHLRPGHSSCSAGGGCYFSEYLHLADWVVSAGDRVRKGELIGFSGKSSSGFEHLHFEIRDATPDDPLSAWQRDAVHPLHALPHDDPDGDVEVAIDRVWRDGDRLRVRAVVTQTHSALDLKRVRVRVFETRPDGPDVEIAQPGDAPDPAGYNVTPPWFDVDAWNRQYTHKNSRRAPWSSFGPKGVHRCPYADEHADDYDPNVHLDGAHAGDRRRGRINGLELAPEHFNARKEAFVQRFTFRELVGPEDPEATLVVVEVQNVSGRVTSVASGPARVVEPPARVLPAAAAVALAALTAFTALALALALVRRRRRSSPRESAQQGPRL